MPKLTIHPSVRLCDRHAVPTLLKSFRRFWNNSRTQIRHNEQVGSRYFKIVKQTFGPRTSTPWRQPFCLTDCRGRGGEGVLGKCHLRSEIYLNIFVQKVSNVFVIIVLCFCVLFFVLMFLFYLDDRSTGPGPAVSSAATAGLVLERSSAWVHASLTQRSARLLRWDFRKNRRCSRSSMIGRSHTKWNYNK